MIIKFNFGFIKYSYYNNNLQRHRLDGPNCETTKGNKSWRKNGKLYREDGPAIELYDGYKYYYINDNIYNHKEYWKVIRFKGFL